MSNKTFTAVRSLVLKMSNLSNPSILSVTQHEIPYGIMQIDLKDKSQGYWVLNTYSCVMGQKNNCKVDSKDIVFPEDLDLSGIRKEDDGVHYLWRDFLTPWSSMAKMENYRNSLIKIFKMDRSEVNRDRGLPYRAVVCG